MIDYIIPESNGEDNHREEALKWCIGLYRELGFSILPLEFRGKKALIPWKEYRYRKATEEEIEYWFENDPPKNIGVVGGKVSGNLVVLDFDRKELGREFIKRHPNLQTLIVETGKGYHVYLRTKKTTLTSRIQSLGLDIRGEGSYVVAPPSIHKNGKVYKFLDPSLRQVMLIDSLKDFDFRSMREQYQLERRGRKKHIRGTVDFDPKVRELLNEALSTAKLGTRNTTGFALLRKLRDRGIPKEIAKDVILTYADGVRTRGDHLYTREEALASLDQVYKHPPRYKETQDFTVTKEEVIDFTTIVTEEQFTDRRFAERFKARQWDTVRYCRGLGWFIWDGRIWSSELPLTPKIDEVVRDFYLEAWGSLDERTRNTFGKIALKGESYQRRKRMLEIAKERLLFSPVSFDKDPLLLNCLNGTLNLQTGEFYPHKKEDYITKMANVEYDPKAQCPMWLQFLEEIMAGSREKILYLQKAVGYSLTGDTSERCFFLCYGIKNNGKSTFLSVIKQILGDYAKETPIESLMLKHGERIPNDIARLRGARLVTAREGEEGQRFNASLIKTMTGGTDIMTARFLHAEFFEFHPQFKLWLATNHKPIIRATDAAMWERVRLVPFTVIIPEERQDKHLAEKLIEEAPGILNWALEGCRIWLAKKGLDTPAEITSATEQYREEMDDIGRWIEENCLIGGSFQSFARDLYQDYQLWCQTNGVSYVSKHLFSRYLQSKGFERRRSKEGIVYLSIKLRESSQYRPI